MIRRLVSILRPKPTVALISVDVFTITGRRAVTITAPWAF